MTHVLINYDADKLPQAGNDCIPVQIYNLNGRTRNDISTIGSPVITPIRRLGIRLSPLVFDFLTIALAVTAADTFVKRGMAADGWTREISLSIPLYNPDPWQNQKDQLEQALSFLSGDIWNLEILSGGYPPPVPFGKRHRRYCPTLSGLNCVSLFSGGLDSTVGAINLLESGYKPLLISHSYKGDNVRQKNIHEILTKKFSKLEQLAMNAYPIANHGQRDITMRTRSFNFLSFGIVGAYALCKVNNINATTLFVPENGFISLNVPLTRRRIGSLSTRTTHPHFLSSMQSIFNEVGIGITIENPYKFTTKGEMLEKCKRQDILAEVILTTVSCGKWKRKNKQCGQCIPCLIRRAAIDYSSQNESNSSYINSNLENISFHKEGRDDLFAVISAIRRLDTKHIGSWILDSGPLPFDIAIMNKYKDVFIRGLREVEQFLHNKDIIQ